MSLSFELKLSDVSKKYLKSLPKNFVEGLREGFRKAMFFVEHEAKKKAPVRTGHLRRSITSNVRSTGKDVYGILSANTVYAALRELGGTVVPKTSEFLSFQVNGQWIRTKQSIHPPRPYLEPSISTNLKRIEDIITKSIINKTK